MIIYDVSKSGIRLSFHYDDPVKKQCVDALSPSPPMLSPAPFVDALALCPSGKHDISPAQKLIGRIP